MKCIFRPASSFVNILRVFCCHCYYYLVHVYIVWFLSQQFLLCGRQEGEELKGVQQCFISAFVILKISSCWILLHQKCNNVKANATLKKKREILQQQKSHNLSCDLFKLRVDFTEIFIKPNYHFIMNLIQNNLFFILINST